MACIIIPIHITPIRRWWQRPCPHQCMHNKIYHQLPSHKPTIGTIVEIQTATIRMSGSARATGKKYLHNLPHNKSFIKWLWTY